MKTRIAKSEEGGPPSLGVMLAVGVVSGCVTGVVVAIASLSPGLGLILGAIVGLISMAFASERLAMLPFKWGARRR